MSLDKSIVSASPILCSLQQRNQVMPSLQRSVNAWWSPMQVAGENQIWFIAPINHGGQDRLVLDFL